jgi:lactoylglutathione lyase
MVRVNNLDKSLDFFVGKLGLKETKRYDNEAGRFTLVFLSAIDDLEMAKSKGGPTIELTYNWPSDDGKSEEYTNGRNFGHLAFAVDDIYETCKNLMDKGVDILRPPRDGYMAFIKSPDNISVELLQKGEALAPIEPWLSMANQGSW